jgi:serine/threonine protein phosphatase 1
MRTIAIGDIHGCLRAFDTLLERVKPTAADRLITLGDYVDRGPDSAGVLDRLVEMCLAGNLVALRGNHDQMMLDARHNYGVYEAWIGYGGDTTLASYAARLGTVGRRWSPNQDMLENVPEPHWNFLEHDCVNYYETPTHIFVHANLYYDMPLEEQPLYMLHYEKFGQPLPHTSGKIMVCGHTSQKSGAPIHVGHAICIDTWVYGQGWLSALDVNSGELWQANQYGDSRAGSIDDFRMDVEDL